MPKEENSWRLKMRAQRELKKKGAELLHERVTLLVEISTDPQFLEHCEAEGLNVWDYLDEELSDVNLDFVTAKLLLENYPDAKQWRDRGVRELIADTIEARKKDKPARETKSWKDEALRLQKENERLLNEIATLNARIKELEGVVELLASGRRKSA